jgi:hypothetical protein
MQKKFPFGAKTSLEATKGISFMCKIAGKPLTQEALN